MANQEAMAGSELRATGVRAHLAPRGRALSRKGSKVDKGLLSADSATEHTCHLRMALQDIGAWSLRTSLQDARIPLTLGFSCVVILVT